MKSVLGTLLAHAHRPHNTIRQESRRARSYCNGLTLPRRPLLRRRPLPTIATRWTSPGPSVVWTIVTSKVALAKVLSMH